MKRRNTLILIGCTAVVTALLTLVVMNALTGGFLTMEDKKTLEATRKLVSLEQYIEDHYVDGTKGIDLMEAATKGMFNALNDPYSAYYNKEEFQALQDYTSGSFTGIGVVITEKEDGTVVVVSPIKDTPAEKAGIKTGDVFVQVNGKAVKGKTSSDLVKLLKGEEGTSVSVTVLRDGVEKTFEIKRAQISSQSVFGKKLDGNIAYMQITQFDEDTGTEFNNVAKELKLEQCSGIVLDLRQDGGGYVDQCLEVADKFLDGGLIVYTEDKNGTRSDFKASKGAYDLPLVVLVDGGSASASEILAGALQDRGVGTLVGTQTFGKGLVQDVRPLKDGTGFKLTVQKYFTPNGRNINKIGITPDVPIDLGDGTKDVQLEKALEVLKQKIAK